MKHFYKIVKKRKHKRRIGILWLFLIVIELFCPIFCDEPTFAAEARNVRTSIAVNSAEINKKSEDESTFASDSQAQDQQQTVCNDECLCHAAAIPNSVVPTVKPPAYLSERIAFFFGNPVYTSLPPPFQPPKLF